MEATMATLLAQAGQGKLFQIAAEMEGFEEAVEAYQRGWVRISDNGPIWKDGQIVRLIILCLTPKGYDELDRLRRAEAERSWTYRLIKLLKVLLKVFFGSVQRVLLTLLGSDMVLRWLVFFFKD